MAEEQLEFGLEGNFREGRPRLGSRPLLSQRDNLFIGLRPPEAAEMQAIAIADDIKSRNAVAGRLRPLHVSMFNPLAKEPLTNALVLDLKEALSTIRFEPFLLTLDQVVTFRNDKGWTIVLCCRERNDAIFELQQSIVQACQPPGIDLCSKQAFMPHMTLFYSRKAIGEHAVTDAVRWTVSEFWIIRSLVGKTRHVPLWRWPPLEC